jgi:prephenate dehydrogenase
MLKVGYIGLGLMGKSIARNILKAGFPLFVHNRSRAAVDELVAEGAAAAYYKALALGLPSTRVLPYLAELRFDQGDYADAKRLMGDLASWASLPRLQPAIEYWNPR